MTNTPHSDAWTGRASWRRASLAVPVVLGMLVAATMLDAAEPPQPAQKTDGVAAQKAGEETGKKAGEEPGKKAEKKIDPYAWQSLFDGKTLDGWNVPQFGGEGEVKIKDGAIALEMGDPMTGITYTGKLPKINYEVRLEARRTMGIDFFATTTFPLGDDPCSFVVGGWAGTVVGLSCVDWYDASDNITSRFLSFKDKQWYKIRLRISEKRVEAWIDDEKMVDLATKGHKFSIRDEVDLNRPFGFATYCTEGQLRNIRIRRLKPEEVAAIKAED
jgi:hypothetical protein